MNTGAGRGDAAPGGASPGPLLAVVVRSGHVPLSRRAQPVVAVLSGAVATGDVLEIVGPDDVRHGRVHAVPGSRLTATDPDTPVSLDGPAPDDLHPGDLLRHPGDAPPTLDLTGPTAPARRALLGAAAWGRAAGFPGPAAPLLAHLPDDAVVLLVERRLRAALARHTSPYAMRDDFEDAAAALETIGLTVDADRLRLTAAAALEGHGLPPTVRTLAAAASAGSLAVADAVGNVTAHAGVVGRALDLDMGEGFALGFQQGYTVMGEEIRTRLQAAGRAAALGWCPRCRDVVRLDERLRCAKDGKRARDVVVAVPDDVAVTVAEWRRRAGR